ncbi:MAG: hypothetical protein K2X91_09290, partial [Thermoleophilia bacterium]|nr:hypothetical protein [Thermoleophilia bacterium]
MVPGNAENGRAPLDDAEGVPDTRQRIGLAGLAILVAVVVGLAAALAVPFLPAISWAAALAVVAWPLHRAIARRLSHPSVAAGLSTAIVAALILSVGGFVTYQIASTAVDAAGEVVERADLGDAEGTAAALREEAESIPYVGRILAWMERAGVDVEAAARRLVEPNLR